MHKTTSSRLRASFRAMLFVAAAVALSGCVIEPLYPHYHPYHYGYGY